jgi:hypothetical protein
MKSVVLQLQRDDVAPAAPSSLASRASAEAEAQGLDPGRPPAFVLAFLPMVRRSLLK